MTATTCDAIVIGAGVIGCSVAYALAADGLRVHVVDRGPTAGHGSTSASSAVVRFNYSTWAGVASAWESRHVWERWEEHLGGSDKAGLARFVRTGGLTLDSPGQDGGRVRALFDRADVPYEEWDSKTIRRRMPLLDPGRYYPPKAISDEAFWADPDGELTGHWSSESGFVDDPALAARNLMTAARRHRALFDFRTAVTHVRRRSDRVRGVNLSDGRRIDAPLVVNVAGPHSAVVNALAGVGDDFAVRTRPLRQEVHEVRAPQRYHSYGVGPLVADPDLGVYFRGTPSGGLLIGGTEPDCDPLQWLDDPDAYAPLPSREIYEAQLYRAARRVSELKVPARPCGIVGVYDVSDDWVPIYDRTELDGFYVAIGTSGNQFKNAPLVGRYVAAIVAACENGRDHDIDPVRLTLPYTGHEVDLSHYSRKRRVNRDSSFTVMG
ncbi:Glycine/D-amino acid oxidase [Streptomyces sp. yr375]|uniref:NAD(P)/FAD-dependent oxidoreductase n=1 Tax=Streptomyces sp. yr375 TaxID=1761906 RepID=UPI0008B07DB7|nr:FAD-dependent oxidoreductase [Streptomyces sp. yr375]SES02858.1 Glycine/D-amino acid oxidase [Streptomyces sp. yr375]